MAQRNARLFEQSLGSPDEALDIPPLSFELPSENIAARKRKREYRDHYRQLFLQMKDKTGLNPSESAAQTGFNSGLSRANAADKLNRNEPGRGNEAQVKPAGLDEKKKQGPLKYYAPSKLEFLDEEQRNSVFKEQRGSVQKEQRNSVFKEQIGIVQKEQRNSVLKEHRGGVRGDQRDTSLRVRDATRSVSSKTKRRNEGQDKIAEKVKDLLSQYSSLLRRLEQQQEAEGCCSSETKANLHQKAADKLKPYWEKLPKKILGHVPGIQVGDEFQSRVMLNMVGMHRPPQAGIDYLQTEETRVSLATSIVVSGCYEDNIDNGDVLIYTGQGGNDYEKSKKQIKDQKLTAGNKALVNNFQKRQPVRVIRLCMSNERGGRSFRYDGLYNVEDWWQEKGRSGFKVFKFKLKRQQGQPPLISHAVQFMHNSQGKNVGAVIKEDIAEGRDKFRVPVVNSVDNVHTIDEFQYLLTVKYPGWFGEPSIPEGCRCIGGCKDYKECLCARRNGGEFPYTCNGKLVKAQPLVYECGPSCRCPPSCRNRVTQHGMKHKLEVFRSQRTGWGVRALEFIEAGEFITEYTGNLTADPTFDASMNKMKFPITTISMEGNWGDLRGIVEDEVVSTLPSQVVENVGFYVDASTSGNASRFISRSSRPNLFAQYVLYDHHDSRIPHVMFFASENISPRLELSLSSSTQQSTNRRFCSKAGYNGKARPISQCRKFV